MTPSFTPSIASHAASAALFRTVHFSRGRLFCDLRLPHPDRQQRAAGPVDARRTGNDAVVILREHLRFLDRLLTACGASHKVRVTRGCVVERGRDGLALFGHFVNGAITEIDELFRMSEGEARAATLMTGIRAGGRVAALECRRQGSCRNGPLPRSVPDALELAVPSCCRHPDFDLDFGIARGPDRCTHTAMRRDGRAAAAPQRLQLQIRLP